MAQTVKNLPAMQENQVQSLVEEESLEKGMVTLSSILAWRIPWKGGLEDYGLWGFKESVVTKQLILSRFKKIMFLLKNDCFTDFCCLLPELNMNQS